MTDIPVPPVELMFDGPATVEDFTANGHEFLTLYRDLCRLQPHEHMLDLGCGIGRKTLPLTGYLSTTGRYEGLDVMRAGIDWLDEHVASRYPNFRFQHIDVRNALYNPEGAIPVGDYRLPFDDASFDFAVAASLFTHMLPLDVRHYLAEIHRVLKPGGRLLSTWFLMQPNAAWHILQGHSSQDFHYGTDLMRSVSQETPEHAVAYAQKEAVRWLEETGFELTTLLWGSWCRPYPCTSYQDLVLAMKTPDLTTV